MVAKAGMPQAHESEVETLDSKRVAADTWHISVRFGPDVLRNGMDPLSILRYLGTDPQAFAASFDRMKIVEGTSIQRAERTWVQSVRETKIDGEKVLLG